MSSPLIPDNQELRRQHEAWMPRNDRLWRAVAPQPKLRPLRPISPFSAARDQPRRRLFTKAIEELDDYGNVVVHELFTPPWKRIALEVAQKHEVSMTDLLSARRDHIVVAARHEIFWRCKQETTMSLPQIGRRFGGRDHTTVLHGIKKHEQRMREAEGV